MDYPKKRPMKPKTPVAGAPLKPENLPARRGQYDGLKPENLPDTGQNRGLQKENLPDKFERFPGDRGRMPMPNKRQPKPPGQTIPKEWIPVDKWGEAGVEGSKKKPMPNKRKKVVMPKMKSGGSDY